MQSRQQGLIGITLDCEWAEPYSSHPADVEASNRYILFNLGWYLYPLLKGDYPPVMRELAGDRLPHFTAEQKEDFKGCLDFLGLNQYTARFAKDTPPVPANETTYYLDICCIFTEKNADGRVIGPMVPSPPSSASVAQWWASSESSWLNLIAGWLRLAVRVRSRTEEPSPLDSQRVSGLPNHGD